MLEIGTEFKYYWCNSDLRENFDETVEVCGYVYFEDCLYYTCIGESGVEVDIHHVHAENRATHPEDSDEREDTL